MAPKARDPAEPLPNATHEAFAQERAKGRGPKEAAEVVGLRDYAAVERRHAFRDRLRFLEALEKPVDATLTLQELVKSCKLVLNAALAAKQFRNANEALGRLEGLYNRYPHLRSDVPGSGPSSVASNEVAKTEEAPKKPLSRLERRMAHRAALSVVPEPAGEGA